MYPRAPENARHPWVVTRGDLLVFALIAVFGIAAAVLRQRTADFLGEDAFYADAAQLLLHHGFYGVNGTSETTQPPGLSAILAVLFALFGYSYTVCVIAMAIFESLGFLAAYELLKRRAPRPVAASICIILLSSPLYFAWATRLVYACFPYFCTTMLALLSGEEYDKAETARSKIAWGVAFTATVVWSLLIATGTIVLLGAIAAVIASTAFTSLRLARTRLLKFLPVLLVGIMVQGLWMHRKPAPLEWALPGYPDSYLNQAKLKNGNYPELGMATWRDIPTRVTTNVLIESDILAQLALRHGVNRTKMAIVIIPVLLIGMGWIYSVWKAGGTNLVDWYFAGYETVYLLWPWTMEPRFLLPVAPLACFYIWQGINAAFFAVKTKPRMAGIVWIPIALPLAISGIRWVYVHRSNEYGAWPDEFLIPLWLISAVCAFWMAYTGRSIFATETISKVEAWLRNPPGTWRVSPLKLFWYAESAIVIGLVIVGLAIERRIARENLSTIDLEHRVESSVAGEVMPSEVEAGIWLRSHTPANSVVMARHWPTVHHYADRKLVWFAPISDPDVLLDGVVKHRVDYVVVIKHAYAYYLPDDDYCFDRLLARHGENFRLVLQRANLRIFRVENNLAPVTSAPPS
jgi:hypothetical protein